jgi:hydroxyacylglutathione hydrolase
VICVIPVLEDNYSYLIFDDSCKGKALIVDPGDGGVIKQRVRSLGCKVKAILVTHHHVDHSAGIEELSSGGDVEVFAHVSDMDRIPKASTSVRDGERFTVGSLAIQVLHVPGHTLGHVAYLIQDGLFTGDTLFLGGCGRLFEGTAEQLYHSLHYKIRVLPDTLRIFPGHEYTVRTRSFCLSVDKGNTLLKEKLEEAKSLRARNVPTVPGDLWTEKLTNVFLRCDVPDIIEHLREIHPELSADPITIFGQLRTMMDHY